MRSLCLISVLFLHIALEQPRVWSQSSESEQLSPAGQDGAVTRRAKFREFAFTHEGDAQRGRMLFENEQRVGCRKCHSVDGRSRSVGPNLFAIGNKFSRPDLISAVLEPSRTIAIGFGTTVVATEAGQTYQGILQRVTNDWIELLDKDNKAIRINADQIEQQVESSMSMMPVGLEALLTPQEFVDVVAYLSALKHSRSGDQSVGVTEVIERATVGVELTPFFEQMSFDHPVWMGEVPSQFVPVMEQRPHEFVVMEQAGRAWVIRRNEREVLFDLTKSVRLGGATGLLGMAFHPRFAANRRYFIKYQTTDGNRIQTVVEERRFPLSGSSESESQTRRILTIPAVTQDHNGGCLEFGPDGLLYIGMGDSGPQGDPQGHGQDLATLLGKILRIDVDREDDPLPYAIPADNPFRQQAGARPEIWAYGFREPWRFTFDSETKDLWVGDVGQNRFEEVAIVRSGENHGWNVFEGHVEHSRDFYRRDARYVSPVFSYPRSLGVSITGGYVYRGKPAAEVNGWYIAGDFESRRIWALRQNDRKLTDVVEIGRAPSRIVSFSQGHDGELFLLGFDNGIIYRMNLRDADLAPQKSQVIAETSQQGPVLWRYTMVEPPADWMQPEFDDRAWKIGPGGFGTAGTPGAMVRTDWSTPQIWLRREFALPEQESPLSALSLVIHHDEDAVVWLNGIEACRLPRWTTSYMQSAVSPDAIAKLRPGRNVMAIHCRQTGGGQYIDAGLISYPESKPRAKRSGN